MSGIAAHGTGPGPVAVTVGAHPGGGADVICVARIAGRYSIAVADGATGEPLLGSPLEVRS